MAVVSIYEVWTGRTGQDTFTKRRTYARVFEVWTDTAFDDVVSVGSCPLLPRLGNGYPSDPPAVCVAVKPQQDDETPLRWMVTIDYDTQPETPQKLANQQQPSGGGGPGGGSPQGPGQVPENPLARPPSWKGGFQQTTKVLAEAFKFDPATGNQLPGSVPVRNSAKLPFDPPVTVEESYVVLTVTRNVALLDLGKLKDLRDAVNSKPWYGLNPRCARVVGIDFGSKFENNVFFWELSHQIAIKDDTWDLRKLDAGFAVLIHEQRLNDPQGGVDRWKVITDENGEPIKEPVPLDGAGGQKKPGDPETYLVFQGYKQRDFNDLIA